MREIKKQKIRTPFGEKPFHPFCITADYFFHPLGYRRKGKFFYIEEDEGCNHIEVDKCGKCGRFKYVLPTYKFRIIRETPEKYGVIICALN